MSTPSEGHTGLGSQAAQASPVTNENDINHLNMSEVSVLDRLKARDPEQFQTLMNLAKESNDAINNPPSHAPTPSHARTPSQISAAFRALQKDWNNPYFPHSLVALRDLIRQYQLLDMRQYYAKSLVFVQSSGMGKSRLADAFGQLCPMINFVLRDAETSGFPPPDEEILSFLDGKPPDNIPGPTSKLETSDGHLKRRAAVAWNHTLAAALLQASFETCESFMSAFFNSY